MPENLKIEPLSDAAFRAFVTSICYASRNLTDGFVTHKKAKEFTGKPRVIQELVPDLWGVVDGGYMIHDFLKYNPTRASVLAKREADLARKSGGFQTDSTRNRNGIAADSKATRARDPVPSPPDPIRTISPTTSSRPTAEQVLLGRPNIFRLYEQLLGKGVSPLVTDRLKAYEESHSEECIEHCFVEAAESNARNVKLVYAILDRHQTEGCYAERPGFTTNGNGRALQRADDARQPTGAELAVLGRLGLLDPPKRVSVGADVVEESYSEHPAGVEVGVEAG